MADVVPDLLPVLSRGKHRTPTQGGCFMEFASWLAGEPWSDHPGCTHPLLASLARMVNDAVSDDHRPQLAPLVPMVVGLDSPDVRFDAIVARRCAITALPIARLHEQRALAVAVITSERILAALEGRPELLLGEEAERALATAPTAASWARKLAGGVVPRARSFHRHAAPTAVQCSVKGILAARRPDTDQLLHDLLAGAIADVVAWLRPEPTPFDADRWADGCAVLEHAGAS